MLIVSAISEQIGLRYKQDRIIGYVYPIGYTELFTTSDAEIQMLAVNCLRHRLRFCNLVFGIFIFGLSASPSTATQAQERSPGSVLLPPASRSSPMHDSPRKKVSAAEAAVAEGRLITRRSRASWSDFISARSSRLFAPVPNSAFRDDRTGAPSVSSGIVPEGLGLTLGEDPMVSLVRMTS